MYKLCIIDDEPTIRRGLKTIIDWSAFDIEIAGEAEDGVEGLQLCKDVRPDVVIVDIKMPGMGGLQMIEEAKRAGYACDFIVLSGYSEFSYAQKATEFGVRGYLLKPIEQEDLIARISQLRQEWIEKAKAKERMVASNQLRVRHILQKLLPSHPDEALEQEDKELLTAYLKLPWQGYQVHLIDAEAGDLEPNEKEWIAQKLHEEHPIGGMDLTFSLGRYVAAITDSSWAASLTEALRDEAKSRFGTELVMASGDVVLDFERLSQSYQTAKANMKQRFFYGRSDGVIVPSPADSNESVSEGSFSLELLADELSKAISAGNRELVESLLRNAVKTVQRLDWQEKQIKAGFVAVYGDIIKKLVSADERIRTVSMTLSESIEEIERQTNLDGLRSYLEKQLGNICALWIRERKTSSFLSLLEYVNEHYGEDIKLEGLAEMFHYNSSYLGKLFKTQTGESFNSYLDRLRMEKAKSMLADGMKVYEVASKVGYANVDYFHLKFKKIVGESPSTYRDRWKIRQKV